MQWVGGRAPTRPRQAGVRAHALRHHAAPTTQNVLKPEQPLTLVIPQTRTCLRLPRPLLHLEGLLPLCPAACRGHLPCTQELSPHQHLFSPPHPRRGLARGSAVGVGWGLFGALPFLLRPSCQTGSVSYINQSKNPFLRVSYSVPMSSSSPVTWPSSQKGAFTSCHDTIAPCDIFCPQLHCPLT